MNNKIRYPNGYYVGEVEFQYDDNGVKYYIRQGKGEMIYDCGMREVGKWVNDKKEGVCTIYYQDGDVYVGEFKHDVKHGKGTHKFAKSGNVYNVIMLKGQAIKKVFDHKEVVKKNDDKEMGM